MKKLILLMILVFTPMSVSASPFLICDPYPTTVVQPDYFEVVIDIASPVQSAPEILTGSAKRLHYDLATISAGNHLVKVKACNIWGCSSEAQFSFVKDPPVGCSGLRIIQ